MGMSIDNANKLLSVITSTITEDDDCFTIEDENLQVFKEILQTAINTMRKYQKIREIAFPLQFCSTDKLNHEAIMKICEVLEDGKDD